MADTSIKHPWQPFATAIARRPTLCALLVSAIFLYLTYFVLPCSAILVSGDWTILAMNGWRLAGGETMYKDIFDFVLPGTELIYAGLFRLVGPQVWVADALTMLAGLVAVWLGIIIARRVLRGPAAFLPVFMFLTISFYRNANGTHHWFSVPAAYAALAVLMESRSRARLAVAGGLCAVSAFFTQVHGLTALAGFAVFVIWESRQQGESWREMLKKEAALVAAFVATLAVLCAYFIAKAGWRQFVFCTVTFGLKYYPAGEDNHIGATYLTGLPSWTHPLRFGLWLVLPLVVQFVYFFFYARTRSRKHAIDPEQWQRLVLLNFTGLSLFLGVAPAPNQFRLSAVSLPAFIIFVWLLESEGKWGRAVQCTFWAGVLYLMIIGPRTMQTVGQRVLQTPAGAVAVIDPDDYEILQWLKPRTQPLEYVFDADGWGTYTFPLHLRVVGAVPFLTANDYTRPEQVEGVVQGLELHQVRLVMGYPQRFLTPSRVSPGDHLAPFRRYVQQHYHLVKTLPEDFQVWERNGAN